MQWFKSLFQTLSNEFDANSNCLLLRMNNGCVLYLWHPRKSDMHPQPSRLSFPLAPSLPITTVPIPAQASADKQCTFCQWSWPWWSSSSSDLSGQANVLSANVVIQVCKHWHTLIKRPLQTFPFHLHLGSLYLFSKLKLIGHFFATKKLKTRNDIFQQTYHYPHRGIRRSHHWCTWAR